jgi:D-amino-acid dehydrogenase
MHVVVIGAGVIGVTTAYYLSEFGCQVTIVDRASRVADGASFGNAGQLSYSFTDAMANPAFLARIPGILIGRDPGCRVRTRPDLIPWGLRFLSECTTSRAKENTVAILKIAMRSARLMTELRRRLPFDFSHRKAGKLVLLDSEAQLGQAHRSAALKRLHGCETEILSPQAAVELEPAIAEMPISFAGAVYSRHDSVADSRAFSLGMQSMLEKSGSVQFRLGVEVKRLLKKGRRLTAVELDGGTLSADAVVVCAGAWSSRLLKSINVDPHIYPVRGYSITLPAGRAAPKMSVTVLHRKTVFSLLKDKIRVAGFADFLGFSDSADASRLAELLGVARTIAPLAADYDADAQQRWGGFRPMTPNGRPRVGPSPINGLFLNTGHGTLGWTLACASSHDIAQAVAWSLG